MNRREFIIGNVIVVIIITIIGGFAAISQSFQNTTSVLGIETTVDEFNVLLSSEKCSDQPRIDLTEQTDEHLQKLDEYQKVCNSLLSKELMIFTDFPYDKNSAEVSALKLSEKFKTFSANGIKPLVIAEPVMNGEKMKYTDFLNGKYDIIFDHYFAKFAEYGVTSQMMGIWVPFPESNVPIWENKYTRPVDFSRAVNKYLGFLKKHFPDAKGSILLNVVTYLPTDITWQRGKYISLSPYLKDLDAALVDSIGIQGFPWVDTALARSSESDVLSAYDFLKPDIISSAVKELKGADLWINTGSINKKYTDNDTLTVATTINERRKTLSSIIEVISTIQADLNSSVSITVNIFAEDKSEYVEATDWSYLQNEETIQILKDFAYTLEKQQINLSIFDI
jgi:hypothetical protein